MESRLRGALTCLILFRVRGRGCRQPLPGCSFFRRGLSRLDAGTGRGVLPGRLCLLKRGTRFSSFLGECYRGLLRLGVGQLLGGRTDGFLELAFLYGTPWLRGSVKVLESCQFAGELLGFGLQGSNLVACLCPQALRLDESRVKLR